MTSLGDIWPRVNFSRNKPIAEKPAMIVPSKSKSAATLRAALRACAVARGSGSVARRSWRGRCRLSLASNRPPEQHAGSIMQAAASANRWSVSSRTCRATASRRSSRVCAQVTCAMRTLHDCTRPDPRRIRARRPRTSRAGDPDMSHADTINAYYAAWKADDLEAVMSLCTDDVIAVNIPIGPIHGKARRCATSSPSFGSGMTDEALRRPPRPRRTTTCAVDRRRRELRQGRQAGEPALHVDVPVPRRR